jgi:hypothetical protein
MVFFSNISFTWEPVERWIFYWTISFLKIVIVFLILHAPEFAFESLKFCLLQSKFHQFWVPKYKDGAISTSFSVQSVLLAEMNSRELLSTQII